MGDLSDASSCRGDGVPANRNGKLTPMHIKELL